MMLTLPTLVAALVLPASAQIFRLPDADACEKSKTPLRNHIHPLHCELTCNESKPEIKNWPNFQSFIFKLQG